MIDYHAGRLLLTWKCSPENEDQAGQRVLYSQSSDGVHWTPVSSADHGDSSTMFPNMVRARCPPLPSPALPCAVLCCCVVLYSALLPCAQENQR